MSEAAYPVVIHPRAQAELWAIGGHRADELVDLIREMSEQRQPTAHPKVKQLAGPYDLLRVRVEGYRAICKLRKPELLVLLAGKRRTVYDRLDVAEERAKEAVR